MNCKEVKDLLVSYEEGHLDADTRASIADHLRICADCRREQAMVAEVLEQVINTSPELPDPAIEVAFLRELEREKAKLTPVTSVRSITGKLNHPWLYPGIAASIALLVAGVSFFSQQRALLLEMAALQRESNQLNKIVALSLIEDQSASKRLQAVHHATALPEQDLEIVEALIDKMRHDKHVNVRLAAANALARFSDDGIVTAALVEALQTEEDSNMQIEIIQILVTAREKKAVPIMEQLLEREDVLPYVKEQINSGINQII